MWLSKYPVAFRSRWTFPVGVGLKVRKDKVQSFQLPRREELGLSAAKVVTEKGFLRPKSD